MLPVGGSRSPSQAHVPSLSPGLRTRCFRVVLSRSVRPVGLNACPRDCEAAGNPSISSTIYTCIRRYSCFCGIVKMDSKETTILLFVPLIDLCAKAKVRDPRVPVPMAVESARQHDRANRPGVHASVRRVLRLGLRHSVTSVVFRTAQCTRDVQDTVA